MEFSERRNQLNSLGVHDLRNIARMWGVPCPTMKLKSELVDGIMKIMTGEASFETHKKVAGRPTKNSIITNGYKEELMPPNIENIARERKREQQYELGRFINFAQTTDIKTASIVENKQGYLLSRENNYYLIDEKNDEVVYVPNLLAVQYGLEIGDRVKATSVSADRKIFTARNIVSINNKSFSDNKRVLDSFKNIVENKKPFKVSTFVESGRFFIKDDYNYHFITKNKENIEKFKENGFSVSVLAVGLPADAILTINQCVECTQFISFFENEPLYSYEASINAINNTIVRARGGEKVLLVVLNIENIIAELDLYFISKGEQKTQNHCYGTLKLFRQLMGLNRCLGNGGSVTIITTSEELNPLLKIN